MNDHNSSPVYLAIDFGEKFTGLAQFCAQRDPYPIPAGRIAGSQPISEIIQIIKDEQINTVIIGLPLLLDGQETSMTKKVRVFADQLEQACKKANLFLKFFLWDETLSTYEAKERMKNSPQFNFKVDLKRVDEISALIILEEFLRRSQ